MTGGRFVLLAAALGALVSVVCTWPLVLAPASTVLDDGTGDPFQFVWNLWWVREALLVRHTNPFFTDLLFYPQGIPLLFHTFSFSLGLLSVPFQLVLPGSPVSAHNLLVAAGPALTVVTVALLAREVTGDAWAAIAGGIAAAANTYTRWVVPVLYLDCVWLIALVLWTWWRMQRLRRPRDVVVFVVSVAALVLASQEYGLMGLALVALDALARLTVRTWLGLPPAWWRGVVAAGLVLALGLGGLGALALGQPAGTPPGMQVYLGSGFALGFVTPTWLVPPPLPFWIIIYLGTVPLVLLVVAIATRDRRARFWLVALVATAFMVLGPRLHLGFSLPGLVPTGPYGPYALAMQLIPFLRWIRAPYRWLAPVHVTLAVLVAVATASLRTRVTAPGRRAAVTALVIAALAIGAVVDAGPPQFVPVSAEVPRVYDRIRAEPGRGAVLDVPSGFTRSAMALMSSRYMYWQTFHGRPLLDGTVARVPPDRSPVWRRGSENVATEPYVEWVVVHRALLPLAFRTAPEQLERVDAVLAKHGELVASQDGHELWRMRTFRPDAVR